METKTGRTYFIRVNGEMVTTASTTAENSRSAMVVAVATKEEFKRKGLATDCMIKLCKDLLAEGKELCLFYDNPEAGKIYKRLGFEDIGFWNLYRYE
ncbi:GNAT family N-acetyltransferase [Lysinibacillus telephonicus]|uniref:GNAT family N-acetyltransferase n=1 Tax=Lysinibacillus telephonicus TaxID=1714840 RepID=UPI00397B865E